MDSADEWFDTFFADLIQSEESLDIKPPLESKIDDLVRYNTKQYSTNVENTPT